MVPFTFQGKEYSLTHGESSGFALQVKRGHANLFTVEPL